LTHSENLPGPTNPSH